MNKKIISTSGLLLLVIAFLSFTLLNNLIFGGARIDLTEGELYSLSDGSMEIIDSIDEPLNLYFFFSDKASEDLTSIRSYAKRVEELLKEYESLADGRIKLQVVDPEPFSEAEDQAAEFGLQGIPVNSSGDELYFGLAGTNAVDDQEVIAFFQPDKEEFLEYDISKLVHNLVNLEKHTVGLMSTMKVQGDIDMTTYQTTPPWIVVGQMQQLFDVKTIESTATSLPDDLDLLVLIHPKALTEETLYAIDQFVMKGGRLLVFVDPLAEMDRPANANAMMPQPPQLQSSDLNRLIQTWGLKLQAGKILGDAQTALMVQGGPGGAPVRHLAILGLGADNFSHDDVITSSLANINLATAGVLDVLEVADVSITPLIKSSSHSMPMESLQFQFLMNAADLQKTFVPGGKELLVAARISGKAKSAFPEGFGDKGGNHLSSQEDINVIVVADTDLMSDRLWVRVQNMFGQRIASPWANNGDFVINAMENLLGSSSLISIRSRGKFTRPFDVVQDLRREAEARNLETADELQAKLSEAERKLAELESSKTENNLLRLSPEQEQALIQFQEEKLHIRKQLREVRHQLNKDIETLGTSLKFINIALIPILLTFLILAGNYLRMTSGRSKSGFMKSERVGE